VASATFDAGRTYRYSLVRSWEPGGRRLNFLMLNPSTADATRLDPTVRRCLGFARSWGFGTLEVTNLFAYRATDPRELLAHEAPVGPANDRAILDAAGSADQVAVAWGARGSHRGRADDVADLLAGLRVRPLVLGVTREGQPLHPLYVRGDAVPVPWHRG